MRRTVNPPSNPGRCLAGDPGDAGYRVAALQKCKDKLEHAQAHP
jgi:hypothetical protein